MSQAAIRAALETQLNSLTPAIATSWQNVAFAPPAVSVPYQEVHLMFADPDNPEMSSGYRELGYMQVKLKYQIETGPAISTARAMLIRSSFVRGQSFVNNGVNVTVSKTPTIESGSIDGDRWVVPVKIQFFANLF